MTTVMSARAHVSLLVVVVVWAGSFSVIKQLLDDGVTAGDIAILRGPCTTARGVRSRKISRLGSPSQRRT